jgi:hypothetical protein
VLSVHTVHLLCRYPAALPGRHRPYMQLHCLAASGPICSTQPMTALVHRATSPSGKVVRLGA